MGIFEIAGLMRLAGQAMGLSNLRGRWERNRRGISHSAVFEQLESRTLLDAVSWTGAAGDNLWHTPGNWSNNAVPRIVDDVTINVPSANPTITFNAASGARGVRSLTTSEAFAVVGGSLEVVGTATFFSTFTISGGTVRRGVIDLQSTSSFVSGTLDSVTVNGNWSITQNRGITVVNGLTLNGRMSIGDGSSYGYVEFNNGAQTLGGTGTVVFGNGDSRNSLLMQSANALTIGSGITVQGTFGNLGFRNGFGGSGASSIINNGTIQADVNGGTISIAGGSFQNTGAIRALNGGSISISQSGTGSRSSGTIDADAGSVITVSASFANAGNTMSFSGIGTLRMSSNVTGGNLNITSGSVLNITGGTLDAVTIIGEVRVVGNTGFSVVNGLTLNGRMSIGDGSSYGYVEFNNGAQTLGGTGTVVFGNGDSRNSLLMQTANALTIGSGITVQGAFGNLGFRNGFGGSGASSIINNGTIAWTTGTSILVPTRVINNGSITVDTGGVMAIGGTVQGGVITTTAGARLRNMTLDGVTASGDFRIVENTGFSVVNGLTLNGRMSIGDGSSYGFISFISGAQTLGGTGSVVFGNGDNRNSLLMETANALTIGSGITVQGAFGNLGFRNGFGGSAASSIINNGTIQADVNGGTINISGSGDTLRNNGTLSATNGLISISTGSAGLTNAGLVSVGILGSVSVSGPFQQLPTGTLRTVIAGAAVGQFGRMSVSGSAELDGTLEVALVGGYVPIAGNNFQVLSYSSRSGQFANFSGLTVSPTVSLQPTLNPTNYTLTTVTSTTVAPDLRVVNLLVSPSTPQSGRQVTVTWNVLNAGSGPTGASWTDRIVVVNTATGQTISSGDVQYNAGVRGNLAAGAFAGQSFTFTLPDGITGVGTFQAQVTTDFSNTIAEFYPGNVGESNNTTSANFTSTLAEYADLQVSGLVVVTNPVLSGQNATVRWNIANSGNSATVGSWVDRVTVTNVSTGQSVATGDVAYDSSVLGAIAAGASSAVRFFTFRVPDGVSNLSDLRVTVITDASGQITEFNPAGTGESNNTSAITTAVAPGPYPDLVGSSASGPASAVFGTSFTVNWSVLNSGTAPLSVPVSDRIYLSADAVFDGSDRLLDTVALTSQLPVAPGANYSNFASINVPVNALLLAGTYRLIVVVDALSQQFELSESNNIVVTQPLQLSYPALPDLVVTDIQTVSEVIAGQTVTISWVMRNQGAGLATGTWQDQVFFSSDTVIGNDQLLGTFSFSGELQPGVELVRTQTISIPSSLSGTGRIVVRTDSGNAIVELPNEDNNAAIDDQPLLVIAPSRPNLTVTSVNVPPNASSGQSIAVDWIVSNVGTASTNALGWIDRVYLSLDGEFDNTDLDLGQVQNSSYLNAGESYASSLTVSLPQGISGSYRIIVRTDSNNSVNEGGLESDNVRASVVIPVTLTPPPDLVVSSVLTAPAQVFAGDPISVSWTVTNQGTGPTLATEWVDDVFLSLNGSQLDAADIRLARNLRTGALTPGAAYTVSNLPVQLPAGLSSENAFIIVRTDATNTVFEHVFEVNNNNARQQGIFALPPPDLRVTTVTAPTAIASGQALTVSYTVINEGLSATLAGAWVDTIYLSPTPTLDLGTAITLGSRSRAGNLAVDQSETRSYTFNLANELSGTFYVIVSADSSNHVAEPDNTNNILAAASPLVVTFAPADLVVTSVSVAPGALSGQDVAVSYTVRNQGSSATPVGSWADAIYLSSDATLDAGDLSLLQLQRPGVLAAGQTESRTLLVQLPADRSGNFFLLVRSDVGNQVFELSETNNVAAAAIVIANNVPDLSLRMFSPRLGTGTVVVGASLSFDYAVDNVGAGSLFAVPWSDRVILSSDSVLGNADDVVVGIYASPGSLAAGGSYSRASLNFAIPLGTQAGTYQLFLKVDANGSVTELSEQNNASVPVPLTIVTVPPEGFTVSDLQVTALSATPELSSGGSITVNWTIGNLGLAATSSPDWVDSVWLSRDGVVDASDIRLGALSRATGLAPGQSYMRTLTATLGSELEGAFRVIVETDSGNTVFEGTGENNNRRVSDQSTQVTLSPAADLRVQSVNAPDQAFSGRPISLSWQVVNLGAGAAVGTWSDTVYLSLDQVFDPSTDLAIGYVSRSATLAALGQLQETRTFDVPASVSGRYYVFVRTDSTNTINERSNEGNNAGYDPLSTNFVYLPPADLVVGEVIIPLNGSLGQNATIDFTVNNNGVNPATGTWSDALYLSSDATWDINDQFIGRVQFTGTVAAGGSYTSRLVAPLPGVIPGNYSVIVRSDIRNNLPESNENNNLTASLGSFVVDSPQLTLGVASAGLIVDDGAVFYRVNVGVGETLVIEFDSLASTGFTELYASFGTVPSRSRADFRSAEPFRQDQRIIVPLTRAGTYYIMAYGTDVPAPSSSFNITARTLNFTVLDTDFGNIGASPALITLEARPNEDLSARNTLRINGAKFTGLTTATIQRGNRSIAATSYWLADSSTLYATFDLPATTVSPEGAPLEFGRYDLTVSDPAGGAVTVPNSVNVIPNARNDGRIQTRFDGASTVQINGTYPVSVQIGNTGTADTYAPLITLSSERVGTPFGFSASSMAVQTIQFLGINQDGPAGVYRPGASATYPLFYRANSTNVAIDMGVITAQDRTPIDWSSLKDSLRPATISLDAWTPIFQNITGSIPTWGAYVVMLNENATALSQLGQRVTDLGTLWSYEVQQAMGTLGPVQTLASAVDASVVSPGLSLGLSRSFGANLADRNATGMFGRGWSTTWDTYLNVTSDGTVNILDAAGLRRQFTPVPNQPGAFTAQPGDSGVLSFFNDAWQIQESSGSVTGFRSDGRIEFIEDVNTNRISASYTNGRLSRLTHSAGQYLDIATNPSGRPTSVTDSAGRTTTYTYDNTNTYLLSATGSDGITTSYTYQTSGSSQVVGALMSVTTAGVSQLFSYDTRGRLATTSRNTGLNLITYTYDSAGGVNVADDLGSTSLFYDARGLLSRTQDPFGNITSAIYGDDFRISQIIDPLGQTQSFGWDNAGSLTSSTDQLGNTTRFNYDWIGQNNTVRRMTSFTDANGNITRYTYDTRGNRTSTIYADGSVEFTNAYDAQGIPLRYTNRRGQVMQYQYDTAGQVTRQIFDDGSFIDLAYDARGNLTTVTEPGSRITTYTYDTADRLTRVTYPEGRYLDYTYDVAGRRASMTDQTGYRTNYFYDALGRLSRLTDTAGVEIVRYTYDAGGRLFRTDKGNGTYTVNTYDAAGQITSLVNYAPSGSVNSRFDYTYDALGRRTSQNTVDGRWVYGYDSTGQLTSAVFAPVPGSTVPAQSFQYAYDAVGNRVSTTLNGSTTIYITNNLNQYTQSGSTSYEYDPDGNLTGLISAGTTLAFEYDQQNRVVRFIDGSGTQSLRYNVNGALREVVAGDVTLQLLIDPVGMAREVAVFDGLGNAVSHSIWGNGLEVIEIASTASRLYLGHDAVGTLADASDLSGSIVARKAVDPFGRVLWQNGTLQNVGGYGNLLGARQIGSGIFYMRARYYSADLGRFVSLDPIDLMSGDVNFYRSNANNPISFVDPTGLAVPFLVIAAVGAIGGITTWAFGGSTRDVAVGTVAPVAAVAGAGVIAGAAFAGGASLIGSGIEAAWNGRGWSGFDWSAAGTNALYDGTLNIVPTPKWFSPGNRGNSKYFLPAFLGQTAYGRSLWRNALYNAATGDLFRQWLERFVDEVERWIPEITVPQSADPNDILGPDGVGAERWISAANPINYTIRFENDPLLANAPAQFVRITQTLDADLDPRSFRLGTFGFSGFLFEVPANRAFYATRLDVRGTYGIFVDVFANVDVTTGVISWTFTSIDPLTGERPVDRFIGFLPPNITRPEGDGFVTYTVRPRANVANGARSDAVARIFFDENAPIDTPPIFNTIDTAAAASRVLALPAQQDDRRVRVSWTGGDGDVGSGIRTYDVFVSRDGRDFSLWLDDTTLTEADFQGEFGSTYAFYTVATDNVGNVESAPFAPDATIRINASGPRVTSVLINGTEEAQRSMVNSIVVTFDMNVVLSPNAFRLVRIDGSSFDNATIDLRVRAIRGTSVYEITFAGRATERGTLLDGLYELRIDPTRVRSADDGDAMAATSVTRFHRLFGDADGDRDVDALDLRRAAAALDSVAGQSRYVWWLDYDADGDVQGDDLLAVRRRLGVRLR